MMTALEFMNSYEGFDWKSGTIVISEGNRVYMFNYGLGMYHFKMPKIKDRIVIDWTHSDSVMAMRIKEEEIAED